MMQANLIHCAEYGYAIGEHDGKSTINKTMRCKNCGKYNLFRVNIGKTEIVNEPMRISGAGTRFY